MSLLSGCGESSLPVTQNNLAGSWQAKFDGETATITLSKTGDYEIQGAPSGLFLLSGWGKIPPYGSYRLDDEEITWQSDGATSGGGAKVSSLTDDKLVMALDTRAAIEWTRVTTPAAAATPAAAPAGAADDESSDDQDQ